MDERRDELLCILDDIENKEGLRKRDADEAKQAIDKLLAKVKPLRHALTTRHEPRPVACKIDGDLSAKTVSIVRLDTGEIVETREMTKHDLEFYSQRAMDLEAEPAPDAP